MYTRDKRKTRQSQTTAERLYYKFIAGYVEGQHKEIHKECMALYEQAKHENPGVKDLTKTAAYMRTVHPGVEIPRYYNSRKIKSSLLTQTEETRTTHEIVLNIPLLSPQTIMASFPPQREVSTQSSPPQPEVSTVSTQSSPEVSTLPVLSPEIYQNLLDELRRDPELWKCLNDFPIEDDVSTVSTQSLPPQPEVSTVSTQSSPPQPEVSTVSTQSSPEVSTLPVLSPEIYQNLLDELRRDPELWKCLNDFPIEDDDDDINQFILEDMQDVLFDDGLTPLESELETFTS